MIDKKYDTMRIKYPFFSLKYSTYLRLAIVLTLTWFVFGIFCFFFTRDSQVWTFKNAWWILLITTILSAVETFIMINKSKKNFAKQLKNS